jgi:two-component system, oxyanion-binding sensor
MCAFFVGRRVELTLTASSDEFGQLETRKVRLGVVPLTDCAPIAIAYEMGLFQKWGLEVTLSREPSWANIRDKVAVGALDGAQMLAALPLATTLGLGGIARPMVTALSLDLNGNGITLSCDLWQQILHVDPAAAVARPLTARALQTVVARRKAMGAPPLTFAVVFPFSSHNYLLRYWLAEAGIDPDEDIRLIVVPPPLMVAKLEARHIDGFCVGAPWNQRAVELGIGRMAASTYEIWNNHPEKVFAVGRDWAERNPNTHRALLAAIIEACRWLDDPTHHQTAVQIIAGRGYVDVPEDIVAGSLTGAVKYGASEAPRRLPDFNVFFRYAANFPWRSHAEWTLTQMRRWGQIGPEIDIAATAAAVYRPEIYRDVADALGLSCPVTDRKIEGTHPATWSLDGSMGPIAMGSDVFFDGRIFDPDCLDGYLAQLGAIERADAPGGAERPPFTRNRRWT